MKTLMKLVRPPRNDLRLRNNAGQSELSVSKCGLQDEAS